MCVSVYEYMHMSADAPGVQKQVSIWSPGAGLIGGSEPPSVDTGTKLRSCKNMRAFHH